jgi:hypothetical protein
MDGLVTGMRTEGFGVLFVNELTLLPVLVPLAPASSVLARFPPAFAAIAANLGVSDSAVRGELTAMNEQTLRRASSRSVLGIMNTFARLADNYRLMHDDIDLLELALWLSQVLCSPLYSREGTPRDQLKAQLA